MNYYIIEQDPRIEDQPVILDCPEGFDPVELISANVMEAPSDPLHIKLTDF